MPLPANVNRNRNRGGTITLNHSVLFRKIAPRIAPGTDPRPPTTDHRERADALDRGEDLLAERLLVQHEQAARERREEAGEREREQLRPRRAQAERLRVALVVARRDDVALTARPLEPAHREQHEDEARGHEVVVAALGVDRDRRRTASTAGGVRRGR